MKATSVSSAALSNAMRYQQMRMQAELVKATKESTTGKVADVGLALGARTSQAVTFSRDLDRLNVIIDSNALVSARLSSTQSALGQLSDAAQNLLSALTAASRRCRRAPSPRQAGKAALAAADLDPQHQRQRRISVCRHQHRRQADRRFHRRRLAGQGRLRRCLRRLFRLHADRSGRRQHHRRPDGQLHHQRCRAAVPRRRLAGQLVERHRPADRQPHRAQRNHRDLGQRQRRRHPQTRHGCRHGQRACSRSNISQAGKTAALSAARQALVGEALGRARPAAVRDRHRREARLRRQRPHEDAGRPVRTPYPRSGRRRSRPRPPPASRT